MSDDHDDVLAHRLASKLGMPQLPEILGTAAWRNIQPIFIAAMRQRSNNMKPIELLAQYEAKRQFFGVSSANERSMLQMLNVFHEVMRKEFRIVDLSPITPLGLNSSLTSVSQDTTLSTIRSSEVVSDPTTPLSLECAHIRKRLMADTKTINDSVDLATKCTVLRLQPFDSTKGYLQHFQIFGLCSGGRNHSGTLFSHVALTRHVRHWLMLLEALSTEGWGFENVRVDFSDVRILNAMIEILSLPRDEIALEPV